MRLFIGITLDDTLKRHCYEVGQTLHTKTGGNLTARDNHHLTLAFLGELDDSQKERVIAQLNTLQISEFTLFTRDLGSFQKGERFIYYVGLAPNPALKALYQDVMRLLEPLNITIHGTFHPHITLIRQGKPYPIEILKSIDPQRIAVNQVTLFLSHRLQGQLTYTPIYHKTLNSV
ncbi:RNA 2',3'-cyclic phosphodiesterase [Methanobacterium sp. YSL]|nr:RNA 2',3'-cyclic phosphodiesterase [Methanobacterium sp. YSL]